MAKITRGRRARQVLAPEGRSSGDYGHWIVGVLMGLGLGPSLPPEAAGASPLVEAAAASTCTAPKSSAQNGASVPERARREEQVENELRLSVYWDCPGDELSPHKSVVLDFFDDRKQTTCGFSLKELAEGYRARAPLSWLILDSSWQVLLDARMLAPDEDRGAVLELIDRALAFALADTQSPNHTRRTMLQVLHYADVVVKTEQTNWELTKVLWRADL